MAEEQQFNNIGVDVRQPEKFVYDRHCPFCGDIKVRGKILTGTVLSAKVAKTAIVERELRQYLPKYHRYRQRRSKVKVHNPPAIDAKEGDIVRFMETRPISKTKHFVIIEKVQAAGETQ